MQFLHSSEWLMVVKRGGSVLGCRFVFGTVAYCDKNNGRLQQPSISDEENNKDSSSDNTTNKSNNSSREWPLTFPRRAIVAGVRTELRLLRRGRLLLRRHVRPEPVPRRRGVHPRVPGVFGGPLHP